MKGNLRETKRKSKEMKGNNRKLKENGRPMTGNVCARDNFPPT